MQRQIYIVYASIVDSNGTFNILSGYPKAFDSRNYNNDPEKALKRAKGEFHEVIGTMCKRDDRQLQSVALFGADGMLIDVFNIGELNEEEPQE